jgi:hypothetical protein
MGAVMGVLAVQVNTSAPRAVGSRSPLRALYEVAAMGRPC